MQDVVVLIDREQGGAARMASNGLRLHAAFPITFMLDVLVGFVVVNLVQSLKQVNVKWSLAVMSADGQEEQNRNCLD